MPFAATSFFLSGWYLSLQAYAGHSEIFQGDEQERSPMGSDCNYRVDVGEGYLSDYFGIMVRVVDWEWGVRVDCMNLDIFSPCTWVLSHDLYIRSGFWIYDDIFLRLLYVSCAEIDDHLISNSIQFFLSIFRILHQFLFNTSNNITIQSAIHNHKSASSRQSTEDLSTDLLHQHSSKLVRRAWYEIHMRVIFVKTPVRQSRSWLGWLLVFCLWEWHQRWGW